MRARETVVRPVLADAGMVNGENLSFVAADLTSDAGWADALVDFGFVLHVASPVQPGHVNNEDDLCSPLSDCVKRLPRDVVLGTERADRTPRSIERPLNNGKTDTSINGFSTTHPSNIEEKCQDRTA